MNWRSVIPLAVAGGVLSIGLFLSTATADSGSPPAVTVPSVRPFDPRTDRLATDSTPQLNLVGRPGVVFPNLCEQRARSGFAGQPWTVSCRPASSTAEEDSRSRPGTFKSVPTCLQIFSEQPNLAWVTSHVTETSGPFYPSAGVPAGSNARFSFQDNGPGNGPPYALLGARPAGAVTDCADSTNTPSPYFNLLNGNITVRQT